MGSALARFGAVEVTPVAAPRLVMSKGARDDVDREIVELKKCGVIFERYDDMPGERSAQGAVIAGGAKAAWFRDSEGNMLAIIESL